MPSGADLEFSRLYAKSGRSSTAGLDGALLEQLSDTNDAQWGVDPSDGALVLKDKSTGNTVFFVKPNAPVGSLGIAANGAVSMNEGGLTVKKGYIYQDRSTEGETLAPEHHFLGYRGYWITGIDVANAPKSRDFVSVAIRTKIIITDGQTYSNNQLTSASEGNFSTDWVGATVSGPGIQSGTTIQSVESATSLTLNKVTTATASGLSIVLDAGGVSDIIYLKHRGMKSPTIGLGVTPPDASHRVQIIPSASETAMGGLKINPTAGQTGNSLTIGDNGNTDRLWVKPDGTIKGNHSAQGSSVVIEADATNNRNLVFRDNTGAGASFGWKFDSTTQMTFRNFTGGVDYLTFTGANLYLKATNLGFYGGVAVARQTVTGSRGGNAALASLLTALAASSLITDSSTA